MFYEQNDYSQVSNELLSIDFLNGSHNAEICLKVLKLFHCMKFVSSTFDLSYCLWSVMKHVYFIDLLKNVSIDQITTYSFKYWHDCLVNIKQLDTNASPISLFPISSVQTLDSKSREHLYNQIVELVHSKEFIDTFGLYNVRRNWLEYLLRNDSCDSLSFFADKFHNSKAQELIRESFNNFNGHPSFINV